MNYKTRKEAEEIFKGIREDFDVDAIGLTPLQKLANVVGALLEDNEDLRDELRTLQHEVDHNDYEFRELKQEVRRLDDAISDINREGAEKHGEPDDGCK